MAVLGVLGVLPCCSVVFACSGCEYPAAASGAPASVQCSLAGEHPPHRAHTHTHNAGPSGCGKSTVLSVLAAAVGFDISEWRPPNPVGYEEALYAGMQRRWAGGWVGKKRRQCWYQPGI